MAPMEVTNQNVVTRVVNLPLVSSTYDMVTNAYCNTKDSYPYIKSVCEVAEVGVRTITAAALSTAMPLIGKLEPQISLANDLACKGLDKIEKTLPILHQPSGQIMTNAKEAVTGAKEAVTGTVNGAKDSVSNTLNGVMDRTRCAVQDRVEMTRTMVSGGVNTVMESRVGKLVSSGLDTVLSTSENLVDQYLPGTEAEQENEIKMTKGFDDHSDTPSYYVRLGSLSSKLRQRAYHRAVAKVRDAKQRSQESISQLNHTMDLIEYARKNLDGANQKLTDKLNSLLERKSKSQKNAENESAGDHEAEHIESRTLAIAQGLTQQLQTTCLELVSSLQGLPKHVQDQAMSVSQSAMEVYSNFNKATAFNDLSDTVLTTSRAQLGRMKDSMDNVMDYLVNNTPLNWLVGPFYPRMEPTSSGQSSRSNTQTTPASEVEMEPVDNDQ
ncbi:perilipin-2 [Chanos chanos]|uniref:Perilipin n=1 Tax=Chanos chanos TaxID=29144 RepID=A0A6J2VRZ8_CHACN|nr:perilipin-2 [Chanos chanos]